jgi:hypothetical protein
VINVRAKIENALWVHPTGYDFGTVFPQEYMTWNFTVSTSNSFCEQNQRRVLNIDYQIKQKPKPRPGFVKNVGEVEARKWCHDNYPEIPYYPESIDWGIYLEKCYPLLCPYLSKQPKSPETGDKGIPAYHEPEAVAIGTINKDQDNSDEWIVDLDVPCFEGECAQDWKHPGWEPPANFDGEVFGCDLWIEVTNIY